MPDSSGFLKTRWMVLGVVVLAALFRFPALVGCPLDQQIGKVYLPQMDDYSDTLKSGELPTWSNAVAFGNPVLAQGQIGVAYPIHLVLYRCLDSTLAFRISMLLHFALAIAFAYWCARTFQLSNWASVLSAIAFAGQGFLLIHSTQQWSYTASCWIPLAMLASWKWLQQRNPTALIGVGMVLATQITAGHFQIAFYTQVMLVLTGLLLSCTHRSIQIGLRIPLLIAVIGGAYVLAGVQTLPTAELLMHADFRGRGVDYLQSYTGSPLTLLTPLFLSNPLWDQVIWVPAKTSHVECFNYMGLIPLCLAVYAVRKSWRQPLVLSAAVLVLLTCVLAILPGFKLGRPLLELPGFNLFTASARWGIFLVFWLALLAGKGMDALDLNAVPSFLKRSSLYVLIVLIIGVVAVQVMATQHPHYESTPHHKDQWALELYGYHEALLKIGEVTPASENARMLFRELLFPSIQLVLLLAFAAYAQRAESLTRLSKVFLVWVIGDLLAVSYLLSPLTIASSAALKQSPVLGGFRKQYQHRVTGTLQGLSSMFGKAPLVDSTISDQADFWDEQTVPERRNLEIWRSEVDSSLPVMNHMSTFATKLEYYAFDENDVEFLRLADIRLFAYAPRHWKAQATESIELLSKVDDPALSALVYGNQRTNTWQIFALKDHVTSSRAWLFPVDDPPIPGTDPRLQMRPAPARRKMLDRATPVAEVTDDGKQVIIQADVSGKSVLTLSDIKYPGWTAVIKTDTGSTPAKIETSFGGWRAIELPAAGHYEVVMTFESRTVEQGMQLSLASTAFCVLACFLVRWIPPPSDSAAGS